jgi:hypothetical protein
MEAETRVMEGILVTKPQLQKNLAQLILETWDCEKRMQIKKEAVKPAADKKTNFRGGWSA